jgi:hypothetical protein
MDFQIKLPLRKCRKRRQQRQTLTHVRADEMGADLFISFANHTPSGAMPAFVFGGSSSHDHDSSSSLVRRAF